MRCWAVAKHQRLPCYATGGPSNYPKDRLAKKMDHYFSLGFRGLKVGAGSLSARRLVHAERSEGSGRFRSGQIFFHALTCGNGCVAGDGCAHGQQPRHTWSVEVAKAVARALEPFNPFFLEEPLHYTDPWGYAELCKATSTPIAGGECLTAAYEWRVFAEQDSFDIGQPDASFTGGLGEFLVVAEMMEKRGRKVATHAWGAGGSLMQNVHCGFAAANTAAFSKFRPTMPGCIRK